MSPVEIAHRVVVAAQKQRWRHRSEWQAPDANIAINDNWTLGIDPETCGDDIGSLVAEADCIIAGSFSLLNCRFEQTDVDWHFDPQLRVRSPLGFGPDINYRDARIAGNVKNIWEVNRHQHLTVVAVAYAITGQDKYSAFVARQLESWLRDNPTLRGINWQSSLELGVRLISWLWIERTLRGAKEHRQLFGDRGSMWPSIYWHQWLIRRNLSRGSSSNNHLVGEFAGLFVASMVWPFFNESSDWQQIARSGLEREAHRQTYSSGLNREQAFSYHLFSLELFIVAGLEAERTEKPFSAQFKDLIRRMTEVVPIVTDVGGNVPRYGDADDGLAVKLRSHRTSRRDFLYRVTSRWLYANVPCPDDRSGQLAADLAWSNDGRPERTWFNPSDGPHAFEDAGLYVLTSNRNSPRELFCLADAGSLGFLSIAAHGHADSLSFALSVGGQAVIVDPGTFSYFLDPYWRNYFRSTKAHNTITIDDQDQSIIGGPFLWTHKAKTQAHEWEASQNKARLVASHTGYERLEGRPVHKRKFELDDGALLLIDTIEGHGLHDLQWRLHFHPSCNVSLRSDLCEVTWPGAKLSISLDETFEWSVHAGADYAGWYSSGFNLKEPTCTLIGNGQVSLPLRLSHTIKTDFEDAR